MDIYETMISKKTKMYQQMTAGLTKEDFDETSKIISVLKKNLENIDLVLKGE